MKKLLGILIVLAVLIASCKTSAIYVYTSGEAYTFRIGMTKEDTFRTILLSKIDIISICTREPLHCQSKVNQDEFMFSEQLKKSDYWLIYPSPIADVPIGSNEFVVLFKNGNIVRILELFNRWGELEGTTNLFVAVDQPPRNPEFYEDIFKGLTLDEIDRKILEQQKWKRVIFVEK